MSEGSASPKRPRLDFDDNSKEDLHEKLSKNRDQDDQGSYSNSRKRRPEAGEDEDDLKDCDDMKSKNAVVDAARREHTLVMRLTNKEQEVQECMNQIQEMKQQQTQNTAQLRSMLLDPAINLVFQRMSKEMEEHKEKLKQKQNELNAWKFTPDSQTGMRLMGKCRMLLQENGELGKMISSGRTARLEGEISLHKALVAEMKKNQKELDEFVGELEEDVEGMQGMIFMLQQQLKEAREQITRLQQENEQLRTLELPSEPEPGGSVMLKNIGADGSHTSSSSQLITSSTQDASTTDHESTKSSSGLNLRVPNTIVPLSNSSDSALTSAGSTTDEFSPSSFSLKVTPDSGIQTQEEDEATDFMSVDDSVNDECHNVLPNSQTGKGKNVEDDSLRTSPSNEDGGGGQSCKQTANHSVEKSYIHDRTCSPVPLTNSNGDINVTEKDNGDDGDGVKRTRDGEEFSKKDKIQGDNNSIDSKLTNNSNDDKIEDLSECLGLTQECPTVNF